MLWNECWSTICQDEQFEGKLLLTLAVELAFPRRPEALFCNACSLSAPPGRINGL